MDVQGNIEKAICNMSPLSALDSFSTGYFLKYRNIYDFDAKVQVKFTNNQKLGLVFRYTDNFNYYLLELSQQKYTIKKMMEGLGVTLAEGRPETRF